MIARREVARRRKVYLRWFCSLGVAIYEDRYLISKTPLEQPTRKRNAELEVSNVLITWTDETCRLTPFLIWYLN